MTIASQIPLSSDPSLYVVATPIGNLADITQRALYILEHSDLIACEDTRHTRKLLDHYGIRQTLLALHEHNEAMASGTVLAALKQGQSVALVSDAGTPAISDPGQRLVTSVHEAGFAVLTVPGPCALVAALSVAGIVVSPFIFLGFLPSTPRARETLLQRYQYNQETLAFYEAPHRIISTLETCLAVFGESRQIVIAKELTKQFETTKRGTAGELLVWLRDEPARQKGEFVLLITPAQAQEYDREAAGRLLTSLVKVLPLKQAAEIVSQHTRLSKNDAYQWGLTLRKT